MYQIHNTQYIIFVYEIHNTQYVFSICVIVSRGVRYTVQHIVCGLICLICPPAYLYLCVFSSKLDDKYICVFLYLYTYIFVQHIVWPDLLNLICAHLATSNWARTAFCCVSDANFESGAKSSSEVSFESDAKSSSDPNF